MGRHRADRHHSSGNRFTPRDQEHSHPEDRKAAGVVDAEDPGMVEPDRDARHRMPADEQEARTSVHSDRDPQEDAHLAAADPRDTNRSG